MAGWRIELLGGLRATKGECVVTHFESRKTAALLACLALRPERRFPREELAALIWPDAADVSGRNRLKQSLASLRKLFEADGRLVFDADRFAIGLVVGAAETDASEWERLARAGRKREARALWRGELLPGFYDDFLLDERERLNALKESLCPDEETATPWQVRLPAPATRFVGRGSELSRLADLLKKERWVTLTGPGGMGKTRLAVEAARAFEDGDVTFVALAELARVEGVPAALAAALEFPLPPAHEPLDALCGFLKDRPTLLLLDNAEHLELARLAEFCERLLTRLPELKILVTSRRVLGSASEVRFPLEPLPPGGGGVALFLACARRVRPDFPKTEEIAALCVTLEGMPLAIELCAAWAGALTAVQMIERLRRGEFSRLLVRRSAGGEERHRSVEAVFLSSYASLTADQQALLRGLSVFRGGWTLESAEAVCPTPDTLGDLLALADASLISPNGPERFTMLESLRRMAASLAASGEQAALELAHRRWCAALAERRDGEPEGDYLARGDEEMDNLRRALENGFLKREFAETADLLLKLQLFLNLRGYNTETTDWLERALACSLLSGSVRAELSIHLGATLLERRDQIHAERYLSDSLALSQAENQPGLVALALYHLGRFAELQRLPELAKERHEEALLLRRQAGDRAGIARSSIMLSQLAVQSGALDRAGPLLVEAEAEARASGRESLLADILYQRAHLTMMSGDTPGALVLLEECQERARQLGMRSLWARVTHSLGCTAQELGDELRARAAFLEAARTFHALRMKLGTHFPLWYLARLYGTWEEWDIVLLALGGATFLLEELTQPTSPEDAALAQDLRSRAEAALGSQRSEHLWQQGRTLPVEEILARIEARQPLKHPRRASPI